ncbi:TonB-dependent receptor [Erythrobacter sp. EC-HK427]|uniref:TonB-dependent receptor n=1 Tax=Erythrobacter sp. EC-HK427 TaxID=2038396 RepID=UPI00125A31FC|nr:TonB-dependent receptor [Erythrobacter sp. EC-HK427]VVT00078.1 TonB-dependent receptor [Erythrobacter sp. EC-HK427]
MKVQFFRNARLQCLAGSAIALALATPALAQQQDPEEDNSVGIDTIIVTAQRVEQDLQDVPIAITAVSGDRLTQAGVNGLEGLAQIVPSVTFRKGTTSANSAIVMRGVGTITFSIAAEPSVSTVVDGIVLSRSGQAFMDLVDIERLEVLRGPQGTLFGKNASAGLVNIVSRGGSNSFEYDARAEYFEGDEFRLRGSVAGPLATDLTARVTGFYGSYDGNITNVFGGSEEQINGYEHYGARGILDYDNGTSSLRLIADYFEAQDDCCADVTTVSRGAVIDAELGLPGGVAQGLEQRFVNHNLVTQTNDQQWSLTAAGEFELSDAYTLSVIAGYRDWWNEEIREGDFVPRPLTTQFELHDNGVVETQQISLEARIASDPSEAFFYQAGAFLWHSDNQQVFTRRDITCATSTLPVDPVTGGRPCNLSDTVNTLFPTATSNSDVNSRNYALFGQATYRLSDALALTAGLRYTWDDLSYTHVRAPGVNAFNGAPATGPGVSGNPAGGTIASGGNGTNTSSGSSDNGNLSGRAALEFTPTDDLLFYASYTRGYKGPAFNVFFNHTAPNNAVPIDEETSDAFEIGFKSQFADDRIQFNVAAFTVGYDGFQANNFVNLNGTIITNLTNAGSVSSTGFEADLLAVPIDGLTLRASAAYADARVDEFNPNPLTNAPDARNGTRLPLAPEFVYTLGASYEADLGAAIAYFDTDFRQTSSQFSDLGEGGPIDAYGLWNASVGISDADDRFRLTFHARNITDESYTLLNVGNGQRLQIPRDADRYFGVSLRVRN